MVTMDEFGVFTRDSKGNKIYQSAQSARMLLNGKLLYEYDTKKGFMRVSNSASLVDLIKKSEKNSDGEMTIQLTNIFDKGYMEIKGIKKFEIVPDPSLIKNTYYNIVNYIRGL